MTTEAQVHEKMMALLQQLRRAYTSHPLLSTLVDLNESSLACLARRAQLQCLATSGTTRLPGVRLEGVDRADAAVTAVELVPRAASLLAASLHLMAETNGDMAEIRQLERRAAELASQLAETSRQAADGMRREMQFVVQALGELRSEAEAFHRLKADFESQFNDAGGNATQIRIQCEEESRRLEQFRAEQKETREELAQIQDAIAEHEDLVGQLDTQRQHVAALEQQRPVIEHELEQVRQANKTTEAELIELRRELENEDPEAQNMREERIQLQAEIDEARRHVEVVAQMRAELTSLEEQTRQDQQEINSIQQRKVELQTRAAQLREQLAATRQLTQSTDTIEDSQTVEQIQQIWQALPADAIDQRLKGVLGQ